MNMYNMIQTDLFNLIMDKILTRVRKMNSLRILCCKGRQNSVWRHSHNSSEKGLFIFSFWIKSTFHTEKQISDFKNALFLSVFFSGFRYPRQIKKKMDVWDQKFVLVLKCLYLSFQHHSFPSVRACDIHSTTLFHSSSINPIPFM